MTVEQRVNSQGRAFVETERDGAILRLILSNPPANVLSVALMQLLLDELAAACNDRAIRVIVIAARGKLFSAGHDLKELTAARVHADGGKAFFEQTFTLCSALMQRIVLAPKPVIAQVDGLATAAGCQLVASCDLAVSSTGSKFGVNGIDVGLFCTSPAVALTRIVNRKRAMHMLLTGEMIDAATAVEFGLVNETVSADRLHQRVGDLSRTIASKSPAAVEFGKEAVYKLGELSLAEAYAVASRVMVENLMDEGAVRGIDAFINRRTLKRAPSCGEQ